VSRRIPNGDRASLSPGLGARFGSGSSDHGVVPVLILSIGAAPQSKDWGAVFTWGDLHPRELRRSYLSLPQRQVATDSIFGRGARRKHRG